MAANGLEIAGLKFQQYGPYPQTIEEAIAFGWTALSVYVWNCQLRCEREAKLMFDNLVAQGEARCSLATLFDNAICRRCGRHPEAASLAHKLAERRLTDWHLREVHFMDGKAVSPGLAIGADIRRGAEALPRDNQVPTVGQLFEEPGWLWIVCERCNRSRPVRTQSLIQQWGRDTSSNVVLRAMRCKRCQWKRAKFQCPSWADSNTGWAKFPYEELSDGEL